MNEPDYREVDYYVGQRVHQRGYSPDELLTGGQLVVALIEGVDLLIFLAERAHNADAGEVLTRNSELFVEPCLNLLVKRKAPQHDSEDNNGKHRYSRNEYKRRLNVDSKRHYHSAEYHKRRAQQQTERKVYAVLYLVHIAGHSGNEGGSSDLVDFRPRQALNVAE